MHVVHSVLIELSLRLASAAMCWRLLMMLSCCHPPQLRLRMLVHASIVRFADAQERGGRVPRVGGRVQGGGRCGRGRRWRGRRHHAKVSLLLLACAVWALASQLSPSDDGLCARCWRVALAMRSSALPCRHSRVHRALVWLNDAADVLCPGTRRAAFPRCRCPCRSCPASMATAMAGGLLLSLLLCSDACCCGALHVAVARPRPVVN